MGLPIDIMGRPFGTLAEVEAEVNAGTAERRARMEEVKRRLGQTDLPQLERAELEQELKRLRTFFWLASRGDKRGEPRPE